MKTIAIIGAGGFAREVEWLIREINNQRVACAQPAFEFVGYIVSDLSKRGEHDSPALGDYSWLENNSVDCLALGIGSPAARLKCSAELSSRFPVIEWPQLIHPDLKCDLGSCKFGEGVTVCANNVFTVNVTIEPFAMVNLSCTIGHESVIGRGSVLNPTVNISGGVKIADGVLVGTGAQILQYLSVGSGAIVGAGAVVNKDVPSNETVVGIPAKPRHAASTP